MDEFLKYECWHCGQSIKYPSEGTGIAISCPACKKPVTLIPEGSTANFGSIVFPPLSEATNQLPKITAEIITLKINAEDILLHKTGKREQSQLARVRSEPATEKQKEKLRWFGCAFNETLTKGQASDALDICVGDFPEKERAYYNRPATEEQMAALRAYYRKDLDEVEGPFTYRRAKDLLLEIEIEKRRKEREFEFSEAGEIAHFVEGINSFRDEYRRVTKAEVAKAWELVKSRNADKSKSPSSYQIVDALLELFSDFRSSYKGNQRDWSSTSSDFNEVAPFSIETGKYIQPTDQQAKAILDSGFVIDVDAPISTEQLGALLELEGQSPRFEDVELLTKHGITLQTGDAFAVYALALLANQFEKLTPKKNREYANFVGACSAATSDAEYYKAMVTIGNNGGITFCWRMTKIKEWYRQRR